jgi:hypothetical protein
MKVRPDVGAAPTAGLADEARFQIREPDMIRPRVCVDLVVNSAMRSTGPTSVGPS